MERIKKKIDVKGDCWIWTGCVNSDGYPRLCRKYEDGRWNRNIKGHRYVYEQTKGKIPEGHVIRHTCDNILCLNPDHLLTGTMSDNMKDRQDRGRTSNFISEETNKGIKSLRKLGLSQKTVAVIFGCSQGHVSKLERGDYKLKG